ncbi:MULTISPECIES: sigma-70 family RNA polymerase sigma factor [Paenibacillus]|uniref:RNA polymerase sigma-70 domain-containing protein n=1 Tax=Paenibacillus odorifer TaxID=189426 RepID=A0ABX3GQ91_9BACL|nr:sigma-70 family RNA polymerase sigma factor [Paenibacillus odorifer]OMD34640.1 hypothetical protein BSO21_10765 [Paenibacillus odorifer]
MSATAITERQLTPDELIQNNMGLVGSIAHKINKTTGVEYLELFQEGSIGLIKAARTFDETKGFKFATYASRCITNEMLGYLRKGRRSIKCESLELIPNWHDRAGKCDGGMTSVEIDLKALMNIRGQEKRALMLIQSGLKQKEVAVEMGVTQSFISRLIERARTSYEQTSGFRF